MSLPAIGIQLYSIPHLLNQDFPGTLEMLAQIGYKEVEFAGPYAHSPQQVRDESILARIFGLKESGYYSHTPAQLRQLLDSLGLTAPSAHAALRTLEENLGGALEAAQIVGHRYLTCEFLHARTLDDYRQAAATFNRIGEQCQAAGIRFAYHNHSFEFEEMEGQVVYDLLLQETDPDLVSFELDLFWAYAGGVEPVDYFTRYPGRFPILHLKDMAAPMQPVASWRFFESAESIQAIFANITDVGRGIIDFPAILKYADLAGTQHFNVEYDFPQDEAGFARRSFDYLSQLS